MDYFAVVHYSQLDYQSDKYMCSRIRPAQTEVSWAIIICKKSHALHHPWVPTRPEVRTYPRTVHVNPGYAEVKTPPHLTFYKPRLSEACTLIKLLRL